jgi:hypothetical protein
MLEEIVTVVDASSREAIQELARRLGLGILPVPSFARALSLALSQSDKRMVQRIGQLVQFLTGDYEGVMTNSAGNGDINARIRALLPVAREYGPQLSDFATLLAARLTETSISRSMKWASDQLGTARAAARA